MEMPRESDHVMKWRDIRGGQRGGEGQGRGGRESGEGASKRQGREWCGRGRKRETDGTSGGAWGHHASGSQGRWEEMKAVCSLPSMSAWLSGNRVVAWAETDGRPAQSAACSKRSNA